MVTHYSAIVGPPPKEVRPSPTPGIDEMSTESEGSHKRNPHLAYSVPRVA